VEAFSKLVDYGSDPVDSPPNLIRSIYNCKWVRATEIEVDTTEMRPNFVASQGACATEMQDITTRTKEITTARVEQQNMFDMIFVTVDKALTLFTQLSDVLVVFIPLIEQLNNTDLTNPQVTTMSMYRCGCPTYTDTPRPFY
jgi:hypothetical protein